MARFTTGSFAATSGRSGDLVIVAQAMVPATAARAIPTQAPAGMGDRVTTGQRLTVYRLAN